MRFVLALMLATVSATASAQTKEECIAASESAQKLRDQHKLTAAREQFLVCARDVCPDAIRQDCTDQVQKTSGWIPSVIVRARRVGSDVVDATVSIDGTIASRRLDGTPVLIDPGVHVVRIEAAGEAPIEQQVVVVEGEHNRVLDFAFSALALTSPSRKTFPVVATVFTGLAIASFAVFATFGILGKSDFEAAKATCSPVCSDSVVDPIRTKLLVADVALGAGVVTGVAAIILYIVHYASGSSPSKAAMRPFSLSF